MMNINLTVGDYIEEYEKNGTEILINDGKVVGTVKH